MLSPEQRVELTGLAGSSLDEAERVWDEVGDALGLYEKFAAKAVPTLIPGHPFITEGQPKVDDFIAFVVDLRDSSKHLMQRITRRTTDVTELQRIYYETSALLPVCSKVIGYHDGKVTEYLGDGLLALFHASDAQRPQCIYDSYNAAQNSLEAMRSVVNPILKDRYNLPPLEIGIGMALSKAVVTLVGLPESALPKAFGKAVFYATKLSKGVDQIYVDEILNSAWPAEKGGRLHFARENFGEYHGYLVTEG